MVRFKKNNLFEVGREAPLGEQDRERGVRSDQRGRLPGPVSAGNADGRSCTSRPPAQELRRVAVWDEADQKEVVLLTDLLDPPAYVVAALYRNRWQVELFFKWLKCTAAFEHAVSQSPRGLTMQFYVAMIGTLLLHLCTGRRVGKYALFGLGSVAAGREMWEEKQAGDAGPPQTQGGQTLPPDATMLDSSCRSTCPTKPHPRYAVEPDDERPFDSRLLT